VKIRPHVTPHVTPDSGGPSGFSGGSPGGFSGGGITVDGLGMGPGGREFGSYASDRTSGSGSLGDGRGPGGAVSNGIIQNIRSWSQDFIDWVRGVSSSGVMTIQFLGGGGPTVRVFAPDSVESANMRADPLLWKFAAISADTGASIQVPFGLEGAVDAGLNPTRQFVGTYNVLVSNGHAFALNRTSLWSLFYHNSDSHERATLRAVGNIYQAYDLGPYP